MPALPFGAMALVSVEDKKCLSMSTLPLRLAEAGTAGREAGARGDIAADNDEDEVDVLVDGGAISTILRLLLEVDARAGLPLR